MWNYRALFWVDGLTSLAALAVFCVFFKPGTGKPEAAAAAPAAGPAATTGKRQLPAIFIMVFGIGLIFSQLFSTYPLYMHSAFGFAESRIGQLLAINTVIIVLFEMVLLHGLKNAAPLKVIALGALLTGARLRPHPAGAGLPLRRADRRRLDHGRDALPAAADHRDRQPLP